MTLGTCACRPAGWQRRTDSPPGGRRPGERSPRPHLPRSQLPGAARSHSRPRGAGRWRRARRRARRGTPGARLPVPPPASPSPPTGTARRARSCVVRSHQPRPRWRHGLTSFNIGASPPAGVIRRTCLVNLEGTSRPSRDRGSTTFGYKSPCGVDLRTGQVRRGIDEPTVDGG